MINMIIVGMDFVCYLYVNKELLFIFFCMKNLFV